MRIPRQLGRQDTGLRVPALAIRRAAGAVRALRRDLPPEVFGDAPIAQLARELVAARGAHHLGNVGVGMEPL